MVVHGTNYQSLSYGSLIGSLRLGMTLIFFSSSRHFELTHSGICNIYTEIIGFFKFHFSHLDGMQKTEIFILQVVGLETFE